MCIQAIRKLLQRKEEVKYLIVAESDRTFAYHNKYYLSLSKGLTYNFRYIRSYIDKSIEDVKVLENELACLVIRDLDTKRLIPVRTIRIFRVYDYGNYVFFKMEFIDYVRYPNEILTHLKPTEKILKYIQEYHEKMMELLPDQIITSEKYMKPLILPISGFHDSISLDSENTFNAWAKVVYVLGQLQSLNNESFYMITGVHKVRRIDRSVKPRKILSKEKGLLLTAGNLYTLELMQIVPDHFEEKGEAQSLPEEDSTSNQVTKRSYKFSVKPLFEGDSYSLELQKIDPEKQAKEYFEYENQRDANIDKKSRPTYKLNFSSLSNHIEILNESKVIDGNFDRINIYFSPLPQGKFRSYARLKIFEERSDIENSDLPYFEIPILIRWSWVTFFWRKILSPLTFIMAVLLWIFAEDLANRYDFESNHARYFAIFLLSFSLQSWGTFIKSFKVETESGK